MWKYYVCYGAGYCGRIFGQNTSIISNEQDRAGVTVWCGAGNTLLNDSTDCVVCGIFPVSETFLFQILIELPHNRLNIDGVNISKGKLMVSDNLHKTVVHAVINIVCKEIDVVCMI